MSKQKQVVYNAVLNSVDHPSAETVLLRSKVEMPSINLATVYRNLSALIKDGLVKIEDVQDSVETVLIRTGYDDVAKAYILYRKQREKVRNLDSTMLDYKEIVDSYVKVTAWRV